MDFGPHAQRELMMGMFRSLLAFAIVVTPATIAAQGNPVSNTAGELAKETGANLLAAAQAMPADKYGFKPTPAQRTFGELIVHIEGDNRITCAAISGATPDAEPKLTAAATSIAHPAPRRCSVSSSTGLTTTGSRPSTCVSMGCCPPPRATAGCDKGPPFPSRWRQVQKGVDCPGKFAIGEVQCLTKRPAQWFNDSLLHF